MDKEITFKKFGKQAILAEWETVVYEGILYDILSFKDKIAIHKQGLFIDLIVGYNSLTIKYTNELNDFKNEVLDLKTIYNSEEQVKHQTKYLWEIPVCYDLDFGIDLEELSEKSKVSIKEIIQLHSENMYTVFFIGFLPGFLYLGGLNEQLFFDRKSNPRLKIEKGAVAIGGKQTGIYPVESPGGWNVIGKSPINFFDVEKENPCFAKSGDQIKFAPISLKEFHQIEREMVENKYQISKTLLND